MLAGDPLISEFMASNEDSLVDGNGRASDWIEIHNPSQSPVDLANWRLTDVPTNRSKWTFPSVTIQPGGYLIVFASGDNVPDPSGNLHTNFQLDADGDYLALVRPDSSLASEYNVGPVNFPNQNEDISYGRGQQVTTTPLVDVGATAKVLIPTTANGGDALGTSWTGGAEPFNDATWTSGATGIGYGDFTPPIQIAGELFVDLDADDASAATASWTNAGTLGDFVRVGGPTITMLDGRRGVQFNATGTLDSYQSPVNAPAGLIGANPTRTIEAWVYNPAIAGEETIVSWARRGGPAGTNMSFNYGTNVNFGAIGHWDAPDIGWGAVPPAGQWNHVVYTYDGTTTRVYSNGVQTNSEELGPGIINTHGGTRITLAAQIDNAAGTLNTALRGTLTIGKMRIHDGVLDASQVANNYELERPLFPLPQPPDPEPLSAAPAHRYSFNDGTANDSIGTLHGTLVNGAATASGALTLDAATQQHVSFPSNDIAALGAANGAVTIEAWGRYTSTGAWSRIYDVGDVGAADPNVGRNYIFISPQSGAGTTRAAISDADPGFNDENFADGAATTNNVNVHIVAVFDDANDNLSLYINGVAAGGATMNNALSTVNATRAYLGRSLYLNDPYLTGSIDEFRVYNYALTRNQALGNFQAGPNTINLGPSPPAPDLEAPPIGTDVQSTMQNVNSSAFVRIPFTVADPAAISSLVLRNRYDDGFVAYLNGVEVARRNAPASVSWDSAATASRDVGEAIEPEQINLSGHLSALQAGPNILAIQGLNVSAADADFLILPELVATTITTDNSGNRFFTVATPGGPNNAGVIDFVEDTQFDIQRGFFDAPFDVTISTITPGATIVYTTDGSDPSLTNGTQVPASGPDAPSQAIVHITGSTPLRAKAFKADWDPTDIDTQTYIFLDNVVSQSLATATADGFPTNWGPIAVDYDVDPRVTGNPAYSATFKDDLKQIPAVSIVMDNDDFFGAAEGVYANAAQRGDQWERPTSIEWIDPTNPNASYQENGGLRAFGGVGRTNPSRSKYSLRVIFREDYGAAKGHFPVFPDTNVVDHNSIVIKQNWNYSWTGDSTAAGGLGTDNADYLRDVFGRDTARDMGLPVAKGRPINLYVNGLYWGLYHAIERTDEQWAAETFGGTEDDFDILKPVSETFANIPMEIVAGDRTAWDQLMTAATQNMTVQANYQAVSQLVDIDQLIDYMLLVFYTGSRDAPTLLGTVNEPRNFWAVRDKGPEGDGKFRFLAWDVEWAIEDPLVNRVTPGYAGGHDNPAFLFDRLKVNPDFVVRVADRVQKHFFNGGALTSQASQARYMDRANEIFGAIVGESARWGDKLRPAQPYTRNTEWVVERDRIVNQFLGPRTNTVLTQLRAANLFPSINAPQVLINGQPQYGGVVTVGAQLTLADPNTPTGTIYYTLDGSDPRSLPSQIATTTVLTENTPAKVLVPKVANGGDLLGTTWHGAAANEPFDDGAWLSSPSGAGVGYDVTTTPVDYGPHIHLDVGSEMTTAPSNTSVFIRIPFTIADQAAIDNLVNLTLRMKYDDGFVAYLNGQEIARPGAGGTPGTPRPWNAAASFARNETQAIAFTDIPITAGSAAQLLRVGANVLAIHGITRASSGVPDGDALFVPQLIGSLVDIAPGALVYTGTNIPLQESTVVTARVRRGVTWSAASDTLFTVETPIRVTELNYHPDTRTPEEIAAGFLNDDDFEYIEIINISTTDSVNLSGVQFTDGIDFTFGDVTLAPEESGVIVHDLAAFQFRYGTGPRVLGQYGQTPEDYQLANGGETLTLLDAVGGMIQSFRYDDSWYDDTDGRGPTLVVVDTSADRSDWDLATGWRESFEDLGSPGGRDLMQGDINLDDRVSLTDLTIIQINITTATGATRATGDLTGDGAVGRGDVAAFVGNLGRFYPPPPPPAPPSPSAAIAAGDQFGPRSAEPRLLAARPRRRAVETVDAAAQTAAVDEVFAEPLEIPLKTTVARRRTGPR